jgi:hypothetical protein
MRVFTPQMRKFPLSGQSNNLFLPDTGLKLLARLLRPL